MHEQNEVSRSCECFSDWTISFGHCYASTEVITILSDSLFMSRHLLMLEDDYLLAFSVLIIQIKYLGNTGESGYIKIQVI